MTNAGGGKSKGTKRTRAADKENVAPKKAARGRGRGGAGGSGSAAAGKSVTSNMLEGFEKERSVGDTTANCGAGVRCKLWLDDLLACCNHVTAQLAKYGANEEDLKELKVHLVRTGIIFALKTSVVLQTEKGSKTYKKWSTLRPAFSEHALWHLIQAGDVSRQLSVVAAYYRTTTLRYKI